MKVACDPIRHSWRWLYGCPCDDKYNPQRGAMRLDGDAEPREAHRGLREEAQPHGAEEGWRRS